DEYLSNKEALKHAGIDLGCAIDITWIEAENLEAEGTKCLDGLGGILVPGGFGVRGTEGKICAIKYARENDVPFFGLCFGMQLAVIEFARNVVGLEGAGSSELVETKHPVIDLIPEQCGIEDMGGTMRLGNYEASLKEGSLAHRIYGATEIIERHRHRYEVNPRYIDQIEAQGMIFSGRNNHRMEIAEIPSNTFFFASQFHPEFTSRPGRASPPFKAFVKAILESSR
ncbi:MAG: CTP synthetase, partial [Methanocellales archaeon]|nr:CTP synthetase [Methanocellales archaeon]